MSKAPETIWAWPHETPTYCSKRDPSSNRDAIEYRRADLAHTLSSAMELPEVRALVEAAKELQSHFIPFSLAGFKANRDMSAALSALEPKP